MASKDESGTGGARPAGDTKTGNGAADRPKADASSARRRRAGHSLQLGLDSEDIKLARSRAAADAARERRYRFWRGVSIVAFVIVAIVLWAYANAAYLGLPVQRWERQATEFIQSVAAGDPDSTPGHAAEADAPIVDAPAETATSDALSRAEAEELERLLAELDFATGPVDGEIDPQTQEAIREYQAIGGLEETGEATKALLADLREVHGLMEGGEPSSD